jgi:4-hydroxybenzoate polyprenyltransferase
MANPGTGSPFVADREIGWIDRIMPAALRPFATLARWDRPIGAWLLLLPCWIGQGLAGTPPDPVLALLFALGAVAMRGAGCTINDIVDRDLDARVERTRNRPLASGAIGLRAAWLFVAAQAAVGLVVLLALPRAAQIVALASVPLVLLYPFAKRVTSWPQAVLGVTFNWGVLVGAAAATGSIGTAPVLGYLGCVAWTIGYDTIYAMQDREDDASVGIRSTARLFAERTPVWVAGFYALAWALWAAAVATAGLGPAAWLGLGLAGGLMLRQVHGLGATDRHGQLARFRANRDVGLALAAGLAIAAV